jgi:Tfp pilus assembly protein PilF
LKRQDAALRELEQAALLEPMNARFSYVYAVALHSAGKPDAAISRLEKIFESHPNDRDVLEGLGGFLFRLGQQSRREEICRSTKNVDG